MLTNDEFKEQIKKVYPNYLQIDKKGGYKWNMARVFDTIIYPEHFDSVEDIYSSCESLGVPCCLSPLHDKDMKDANTGEKKKAHYHLILYYTGKTSPYKVYTSLCGSFGEDAFFGVHISNDVGSAVRYQCHLDSSDKAQYKIEDIKDFNGFGSSKYLFSGGNDLMATLKQLKEIVKENNILFYSELDDYLEENNEYLHIALHRDRNLIRDITQYMKSREHQLFYCGGVEKGYTRIKMENGTEKVIFNRQIVNV